MTTASSQPKWLTVLVVALVAMGLGAGGSYVLFQRNARTRAPVPPTTAPAPSSRRRSSRQYYSTVSNSF